MDTNPVNRYDPKIVLESFYFWFKNKNICVKSPHTFFLLVYLPYFFFSFRMFLGKKNVLRADNPASHYSKAFVSSLTCACYEMWTRDNSSPPLFLYAHIYIFSLFFSNKKPKKLEKSKNRAEPE